MACFHPLSAYRDPETGQVRVLHPLDKVDANLTLPCGQCQGCRLERSRQWAVRVMHEASLYKDNSFVTLTYNDEHLKPSLDYSDYQKFMKRLRKAFSDREVRFYMCGEYGDKNRRPHFHACLFNVSFPDQVVWRKDRGNYIYRSELLEKLWPFGFSSIGNLTFQSAAYVARYVMKKQTGFRSDEAYKYTDPDTGEVLDLTPEFNRMSLKPGIGARWFEKFKDDVYNHDYLVVNGYKTRPPRYYDKLFYAQKNLLASSDLEVGRYERAQKYAANNTDERLRAREKILSEKLKKLKRSL